MTNTCGGRLNNTVDFISKNELLVMHVFFNVIVYSIRKLKFSKRQNFSLNYFFI